MAALAPIRTALAERTGADARGEEPRPPLEDIARSMPAPPALETLSTALGLSRFEREVLLLCAGVELEAELAGLCHGRPTFSLALSTLAEPHWSALAPAAPLRYWRLVELEGGDSLTTAPLRIDERVLHYLTGVQYVDERLDGYVGPPLAAGPMPLSHAEVARRIAAAWARVSADGSPVPLISLSGRDREARAAVATAACGAAGIQLRKLRAELIPSSGPELESLRRLCMREALLSQTALLVELDDLEGAGAATGPAARLLDELGSAAVVSGTTPLRGLTRPTLRLEVPKPTAAEQRSLWTATLGKRAAELDGSLDEIVKQFDMGPRGVAAAGFQLADSLEGPDEAELALALWEACRSQARTSLEDLAQRIEPCAGWDDLVVPELQREVLRDIVVNVRHRAQVYDAWGFARKEARGLGISALFAGPSGTGKTMAAEVLARELRLDLYRIDLSSVVSKYIGETEKNLRRVFEAAEEGGAILLFDEADALFGKRTEVKDSHDRYANIEVSYLLQRMEAYRGLAILTTNFRKALDPAFLRRLRFVVDFPFPGLEQRREIWQRVFPLETPTQDLDSARLAQLNIAGGNIRNIALQAAFLAAGDGEAVQMSHLRRAARSEYAKLERPLTGSEIGGWS